MTLQGEDAIQWLPAAGLKNPTRALNNLTEISSSGITRDLLDILVGQLKQHLPALSDPDMALNNLERFFLASRSPLSLAALLDRDPTAIPILLRIFATSQYLSDLLITDSESYDLLRLTEGQPIARETLIDELSTEIAEIDSGDVQRVMTVLRRFKHRETLRIAFGDIIGRQELETVTTQISYLADAVCQGALDFAHRRLVEKHGRAVAPIGTASRLVVLACGKLGGLELNYSSDIDLVFVYEADGNTTGDRPISNRQFFETLTRETVKLISETTSDGAAYRVDLRLRPGGQTGPIAMSYAAAISYYDIRGRTWERQALVKARAVAGLDFDSSLGEEFLNELAPWIYARPLTVAEISGIQALKRQIERRVVIEGGDHKNVKTGQGGIRDIEFVLQFLQLLHGGELKVLRTSNTLDAIYRLYQTNCITSVEQISLERGYRWLRKLEHRLQIMFDLQTHSLPEDEAELRKIALRMDYEDQPPGSALSKFRRELEQVRERHRAILDHLLHDAFGNGAFGNGDPAVAAEVDLVLDPDPSEAWIQQTLSQYGFTDPLAAHRHLIDLATEKNVFLSPRRCRHFLAAISPLLLKEISKTPSPDVTLRSLSAVSGSLGGKAALWELFKVHSPSLKLYVTLCASSPYLCKVLVSKPGMIDGLLDSLTLQGLPSFDFLQSLLRDRLRGAEDADLIIHRFKDDQHLRIGVRDVLGRNSIHEIHRALSDVAEVCVQEIASREYEALKLRCGVPTLKKGGECELLILAMGKLGGRDPNYHSDLDVVFLYTGDGHTKTESGESTSNQDFFSRLAAKITKRISTPGRFGRLYEIDSRLRPTGKSGSLAVSLQQFHRYFTVGDGRLWERLALCKARPIFGSQQGRRQLGTTLAEALTAHHWQPQFAKEIAEMRFRMQEGSNAENIKRGAGGTVDLEFLIQMLQLKHAATRPEVLVPGTLDAAVKLNELAILSQDEFEQITTSYKMLRSIEARIRLLDLPGRHDLPAKPEQIDRLAFLLHRSDRQQVVQEVAEARAGNRELFNRIIQRESQS